MIRMGTNPIIFLLDNCEYVIEEQIHPGPYNKLQGWDYCALAHAMKGASDNLFATKVILPISLPCGQAWWGRSLKSIWFVGGCLMAHICATAPRHMPHKSFWQAVPTLQEHGIQIARQEEPMAMLDPRCKSPCHNVDAALFRHDIHCIVQVVTEEELDTVL